MAGSPGTTSNGRRARSARPTAPLVGLGRVVERPWSVGGLLAEILSDVVPEADVESVPSGVNLHTELDLDSLDFLSLVEGVCARTGVTIPERDYGRLVSISDWTAYLTSRSAVDGPVQNS